MFILTIKLTYSAVTTLFSVVNACAHKNIIGVYWNSFIFIIVSSFSQHSFSSVSPLLLAHSLPLLFIFLSETGSHSKVQAVLDCSV